MNWINLKDLENRLVEGQVSEKEGFKYLLGILILFSLLGLEPDDGSNHETYTFIGGILALAITVFAVNLTFKVNQSGDGKDYLKRFISLCFVIGIRLIVLILILIVIAVIVAFIVGIFSGVEEHLQSHGANGINGDVANGEVTDSTFDNLISLGLPLVVLITYFYFLIRSFKKVALKKT